MVDYSKEIDIVKRLNDNEHLLDILIEIENFMDSLDLYVFKNWIDGIIVDGPNVKRHWASIILKFDYDKMPDPQGGMRLIKHGCNVYFKESQEIEYVEQSPNDTIGQANNKIENDSIVSDKSKKSSLMYQGNNVQEPDDEHDETQLLKKVIEKIWLVEIQIPRRFLSHIIDDTVNDYSNEPTIPTNQPEEPESEGGADSTPPEGDVGTGEPPPPEVGTGDQGEVGV